MLGPAEISACYRLRSDAPCIEQTNADRVQIDGRSGQDAAFSAIPGNFSKAAPDPL